MINRKKGLGLLFSVILITVFLCGIKEVRADSFTLKEISNAVEKHPEYSGKMRSPEIQVEDNHLTLKVKRGRKKTTLNFDLADNVLTGDFSGDTFNTAADYAVYLIDAIGQLSGFEYGDMMKDREYLDGASLEDNGFLYQLNGNDKTFKLMVDVSGNIKKPDYSESYIRKEDLTVLMSVLKNDKGYVLSKGNIYLNVRGDKECYYIIVAEKSGDYSVSVNKSVCSAIEVLFDNKDVAYLFDSCYPTFAKGNSEFLGFNVVISPKLKKNEVSDAVNLKESFYAKITMDKKTIKESVKSVDIERVFSWEMAAKKTFIDYLDDFKGEILIGAAVFLMIVFIYILSTTKRKKVSIKPINRNKADNDRFNHIMGVATEPEKEEVVVVDAAEEEKWLSE